MSCTKLQLRPEPLTRGLPPPHPRSLCPLSSTEFAEPHPDQNSWVRHCIYLLYLFARSQRLDSSKCFIYLEECGMQHLYW